MLKRLFKAWAKPKKLSLMAADGVRNAVNSSPAETQALIAKYATIANEANEIVAQLTDWLKDGTIDEVERDAMASLLKPVFEKTLSLI